MDGKATMNPWMDEVFPRRKKTLSSPTRPLYFSFRLNSKHGMKILWDHHSGYRN